MQNVNSQENLSRKLSSLIFISCEDILLFYFMLIVPPLVTEPPHILHIKQCTKKKKEVREKTTFFMNGKRNNIFFFFFYFMVIRAVEPVDKMTDFNPNSDSRPVQTLNRTQQQNYCIFMIRDSDLYH